MEKRFLQLYFLFGISCTPFLAVGYPLRRWYTPCSAATLGSSLFPECDQDSSSQLGITSTINLIIICVVVTWLAADSFGLFAFHVTGISFVQAFSFSAYVKYFRMCLNSSSANQPSKRYRVMRVYRQLQILNRYYNQLQQNTVVLILLFLIMTASIIGTYTIIAFGSKMKLHDLIIFFCAAFDGLVVILVVFSVMANVNSGAVDGIQDAKSRFIPLVVDKRGRKWVEMVWRSFRPLKVCIGTVNFADKSTPFNLLIFCLSQIASLLLLD